MANVVYVTWKPFEVQVYFDETTGVEVFDDSLAGVGRGATMKVTGAGNQGAPDSLIFPRIL